MSKHLSISYRGKDYDVVKLRTISSQGVTIKIDLDKIDQVCSLSLDHLVVIALGDRYEALGGSLALDKDGQPLKQQMVKLLSKPVLKKALLENVLAIQAPEPAREPYGDNRRYGQDPRDRYQSNYNQPRYGSRW